MRFLKSALSALILTVSAPCLAQAEPQDIVEATITDLKTGDASIVIENLILQAPLISVGPTKKTNLINTLSTFLSSYGAVEGAELISTHEIASRLLTQTHIIFLEKYALKLELEFYRSKDGWTITEFNFQDDLDELLGAQFMENLQKSLEPKQ